MNNEMEVVIFSFFFFQAEDGIRDLTVTGVQTCALPIYCHDTLVIPTSAEQPSMNISQAVAVLLYLWSRQPPFPGAGDDGARGQTLQRLEERKSVGEGKSGDLGGCRNIKKKKKIYSFYEF